MEISTWDKKPIVAPFTGLLKMTADQYHADPCEAPSLSSSIAKKIVTESAFHGWLHHPKLGKLKNEASKTMIRGTVIHALVLGEKPNVVLIDAENFTTKAAKSSRDSAIAEGSLPYLLKDYREAEAIADEVQDALRLESIHLSGAIEVAAFWTETVGNQEIQCRALMDHTIPEEGVVHDFKTCDNAHPDFLGRQCVNFGYDIQWAAYDSGLGKIMDLGGRIDFSWIFIEELPEGSPRKTIVQVLRPSGMMRELGRARWGQGLSRWAECTKAERWPAYYDGPAMIDPPEWSVKQALGRD